MEVADGLYVGQDAGADHESQHVDGDEERGAHGEGDQHAVGDLRRLGGVQLHFHHGHLLQNTLLVKEHTGLDNTPIYTNLN